MNTITYTNRMENMTSIRGLPLLFLLTGAFLFSSPASVLAYSEFNREPYFIADDGCATTWSCYKASNNGANAYSYINGPGNFAAQRADCTINGCYSYVEALQGKRPFGLVGSPYPMPPVSFTGTEERKLGVIVRQSNFQCKAWVGCSEHIYASFWADFNGLSACRSDGWSNKCGTGGVIKVTILYSREGWPAINIDKWTWRGNYWEYRAFAPGYGNLNDSQWYFWDMSLTQIFADAAAGVGRIASEGVARSVSGGVEVQGAIGSAVEWSKFKFYAGTPPPPPPICFESGTKVMTPQGERNIEKLAVGDSVYSFDEVAGRLVPAPVKSLFHRKSEELLEASFSGGLTLKVTPRHPFYDPRRKEYRPIGEFKVGDKVLWADATHSNELSPVVSVPMTARYPLANPLLKAGGSVLMAGEGALLKELTLIGIKELPKGNYSVHNLTIDGQFHNYLVEGVVVHNKF